LCKTAVLKKKLLKPVMLNYIKCCTKIKENRCSLYVNKKKVINYRSICDNKVALIKTRLSKVNLSSAFFVKDLKKKSLKNLIKHINNHN
jgi:hypothetical protein